MKASQLTLSFDIGHSSIGWAVFESSKTGELPNLLGTGALLFPTDSCLARDRAAKRRMRRNIASRRNRIKRIKALFKHLDLLNEEDFEELSPWPWHLAANALANPKLKLSWVELWQILRWYAHNRGYDGNRLWANSGEDSDDTKRVEAAKDLMVKLETNSMAATICRHLDVDPTTPLSSPTLHARFKGENVAFPRETIEAEVRQLLEHQRAHHPKLSLHFIDTLLVDHDSHPTFDANLPRRFSSGGLLFGQLTPRFDNRIIGLCPLSEDKQKLPAKHSRRFLDFRWAQTVGNLRVAADNALPRPLTTTERTALTDRAKAVGYFTQSSLRKALEEITKSDASQLDRMILTEEFEAGLVFDPVKHSLLKPFKFRTNFPNTESLQNLWSAIPKPIRKKLFRGRSYTYEEIMSEAAKYGVPDSEFNAALTAIIPPQSTRKKAKQGKSPLQAILETRISVNKIEGRAPYAKPLLDQATAQYLRGSDPKSEGGALYENHFLSQQNLKRPIDELTNNHLVRHRLKLFKRLLSQLCQQFESPQRKVKDIVIEVVKDLQEFSGLNAKETAQLLGSKLAQHKRVSRTLEEQLKELGKEEVMGAGLIRKARLADDLNSTCPYTGQQYSLQQVVYGDMDTDHIVPYSKRSTNSLESLVLTFKNVNEMKGNRTGLEFVRIHQGKTVPGTNLEIITEQRYLEFVSKLRPRGPSDDDKKRCKRRKQLLTTLNYERRQGGFTQGDLTQTSHLNKLAARIAKSFFSKRSNPATVTHLPGSVTGFARKSWGLMGCLWKSTPKIFVDGQSLQSGLKLKSEIREITHLHHALDAISLGCIHILLPSDGAFRTVLTSRSNKREAIQPWRDLPWLSFDPKNRPRLKELPRELRVQIENRLAERRVIFHVPKTMSGLKVEETTWRIKKVDEDGKATIIQRKDLPEKQPNPAGTLQRRTPNQKKEKTTKLLGYKGEKLAALKGAVIISQNFGCALEPTPQIIPFHKVKKRLDDLTQQNNGKTPRVLRIGQQIEVASGKRKGIWKIASVKDNQTGIAFDIVKPHICKPKNRDPDSGMNVSLASLQKAGFRILNTNLAGYECHTT